MSGSTLSIEELERLETQRKYPRLLRPVLAFIGIWFITNPFPDHWAAQLLWTLYTAYILFSMTSYFHECIHKTAHSSGSASLWMGRLTGTIVGIPYHVYQEAHIRHHGHLNQPGDWELWPYSDPNETLIYRRVFVWFDLFLGAIFAPIIYGRIFFHPSSPLKRPALRQTIRREYAAIIVFWGSILAVVTYFDVWRSFLVMWVLPHALAGMYQSWRKFTEHLGMKSYDPLIGTRTVIGRNAFTRLCSYLNFDIFIHGLHHRHPKVTHNNLLKQMRSYMTENPDTAYPVYSAYWRASADMLPWLIKNPGVGMNRGASRPMSKRETEVFESDVTDNIVGENAPEGSSSVKTLPIPSEPTATSA